jgi:hypothetical protein
MKNFILSLIVVAFVSALLQIFLPWYIIVLAGFIAGYTVKQKSGAAFASGFLGVFLLWAGYAYYLSSRNGDLLAHKVALILPLHGNVAALILITGLLGGLVSGFASLTGSLAGR